MAGTGKVPRIWGNFTLPSLDFGWELVGTKDKEFLINTIRLMGVGDYLKGRYIQEMVSGDPDVTVYSASSNFYIPPTPPGGRSVLTVTSDGRNDGSSDAFLNGQLITSDEINLGNSGGTINVTAKPKRDFRIERANYLERQRQIRQYGQSFEYRATVLPNLNFDIRQYEIQKLNKWRFKIFGIPTFRRLTP